jgi:hypothetical protein
MMTSAALAAAAVTSASLGGLLGEPQIVGYWNFNSNDLPGGGFGYLADPSIFPLGADVGTASITFGGGLLSDTIVNSNGDTVYQWIPSFGGSTINAQGGDPAGGSLSIQGGTDAGNNGAFFQFAFSMAGLSDLSVSYASQRTNTGFNTQTWSWSVDGVTFTDFQTITTPQLATSFLNTGVIALDTLAALDDATTAFLRVTFDGATAATGNNRLDNMLFTAVPAPGAIALLGVAGLVGARRRRG